MAGILRRRQRLIREHGARCHYCREMTNPNPVGHYPLHPTVEHIVPRFLGGPTAMFNLVIACRACNEARGSEYYKCFCPLCQNARASFELYLMLLEMGRDKTEVYRMEFFNRPGVVPNQYVA